MLDRVKYQNITAKNMYLVRSTSLHLVSSNKFLTINHVIRIVNMLTVRGKSSRQKKQDVLSKQRGNMANIKVVMGMVSKGYFIRTLDTKENT